MPIDHVYRTPKNFENKFPSVLNLKALHMFDFFKTTNVDCNSKKQDEERADVKVHMFKALDQAMGHTWTLV